ncbi:MAG TPA: hypothetical protein PLL36_05670 [Candidatus Hydrogenedentes bacterium]|nr:hypothetical protein [Candidatus Hydrogenedentota bacterium]
MELIKRFLLLVGGVVCIVSAVYGDVIVLSNGDTLSGIFSRIRENTLVFRTSLEGQMMTPLDTVRTVSSGTPLYIGLLNGQVHYGRLGVREGVQVILPLDGSAPVPVRLNDIKETLPIPTPPSGAAAAGNGEFSLTPLSETPWPDGLETPKQPTLNLTAPQRLDTGGGTGGAHATLRLSGKLLEAGGTADDGSGVSQNPADTSLEGDLQEMLNRQKTLSLNPYSPSPQEHPSSAGSEGSSFFLDRPERGRFLSNARLGVTFFREDTGLNPLDGVSRNSPKTPDTLPVLSVKPRLRLRYSEK